jgi:DMSO/TMAO reductase YedYZ molybdopterin-dependent catalytic subunit
MPLERHGVAHTLRPAVAGIVAVGVALAVGELLAGMLAGVPSLVTAVGALLIPLVPPPLESWAIAVFGTSDKAVLNAGTTLVSLAVGAWAGIRARDRFAGGVTLFVVFGALGLLVALAQPLVAPGLTLLSVLLSAAAGIATLAGLLRLAHRTGGSTTAVDADRRAFLGATVGMAGLAVALALTGRALLRSRAAELDAARIALPDPVRALPAVRPDQRFEIPGLVPILVPNDEFYRIDTALTVPRIDPDEWRLRTTGMVDREVELTYSELLAMPLVERDITLSCVSNEVGGDLVGNARWLGVPLVDVLQLAGVRDGATQLVGRAVDGWTAGFPTEVAFEGRDSLLAVGMNGEPLPGEHGFPARLVVPGLYGYVSATKWLTEIELTTLESFDAYWVPRGWAKLGPVHTASRIDVPRPNTTVPVGEAVFAGVAWAPTRGISDVEIQVDDGPWQACDLTEPLSDDAWVQWKRVVSLPAGEHLVQVRATDGLGQVQTSVYTPPRPDGSTGYDVVRVTAASG